jgi:hypothetical protein
VTAVLFGVWFEEDSSQQLGSMKHFVEIGMLDFNFDGVFAEVARGCLCTY